MLAFPNNKACPYSFLHFVAITKVDNAAIAEMRVDDLFADI